MDSTAYVNVTVSNKQAENRTSPVYVAELGKLSLQDILEKKPDDFNKQIDISWISDALNKKSMEVKYAPVGRCAYALRSLVCFCLWK